MNTSSADGGVKTVAATGPYQVAVVCGKLNLSVGSHQGRAVEPLGLRPTGTSGRRAAGTWSRCDLGPLGRHTAGTSSYWDFGPLGLRATGTKGRWDFGPLEFWATGISVH